MLNVLHLPQFKGHVRHFLPTGEARPKGRGGGATNFLRPLSIPVQCQSAGHTLPIAGLAHVEGKATVVVAPSERPGGHAQPGGRCRKYTLGTSSSAIIYLSSNDNDGKDYFE